MKEAEAREVIRWEAEQHVPFDMDNVELDFQILDPEGEGLQMTVLLVAAKRELVEHKVALLAERRAESPASSTWMPSRCTTPSRSTTPRRCAGWSAWSTSATRSPTSTSWTTACRSSPATSRSAPAGSRKTCSASAGSRPTRPTTCCRGTDVERCARCRCSRARGEELAVGIERAAAFLQSASRSAGGIASDLHHRRRRPHSAAQQGAGRPAPDSGPAGQPDREAPGGRRRVRRHAGGRSGTPADAPDRPRAPQRGVTPTNGPDTR